MKGKKIDGRDIKCICLFYVFWLLAVFVDLSALRVLLDHFFLRIESTIWRQTGVPIERAPKTIMLRSCDIENCEET